MESIIRTWIKALLFPRPLIGLIYLPRFFSHYLKYAQALRGDSLNISEMQPCLGDWTIHTPFDAHYFYQGAWLARCLKSQVPKRHTDIGSSVLMIGVLSGYFPTTFVDFRPIKANLTGLTAVAGDILALPFLDNTIESVSCLHVVEHIGLGRYGDPIDPMGSCKALAELERIVASKGRLYLSLPIGRERICFNAHRVHLAASVLKMLPGMTLIDFSWIDDSGVFHEHDEISVTNDQEYACGLFLLEKP